VLVIIGLEGDEFRHDLRHSPLETFVDRYLPNLVFIEAASKGVEEETTSFEGCDFAVEEGKVGAPVELREKAALFYLRKGGAVGSWSVVVQVNKILETRDEDVKGVESVLDVDAVGVSRREAEGMAEDGCHFVTVGQV